jgi:hypothetical protein
MCSNEASLSISFVLFYKSGVKSIFFRVEFVYILWMLIPQSTISAQAEPWRLCYISEATHLLIRYELSALTNNDKETLAQFFSNPDPAAVCIWRTWAVCP